MAQEFEEVLTSEHDEKGKKMKYKNVEEMMKKKGNILPFYRFNA